MKFPILFTCVLDINFSRQFSSTYKLLLFVSIHIPFPIFFCEKCKSDNQFTNLEFVFHDSFFALVRICWEAQDLANNIPEVANRSVLCVFISTAYFIHLLIYIFYAFYLLPIYLYTCLLSLL